MPGIVGDGINGEAEVHELNGHASPYKESSVFITSPMCTLSPRGLEATAPKLPIDDVVDTSIEKLYENVCEMQSSDQSPSRRSFGSDGDESRIDSELRHLVGGEMREVEIMEEEVAENQEDNLDSVSSSKKGSLSTGKISGNAEDNQSASPRSISTGKSKKDSQKSLKSSPTTISAEKPPMNKRIDKLKKQNKRQRNRAENSGWTKSDNPDLGPFLLKQARDLMSSGDNLQKALELAIRAAKSFEIGTNGKPSLELAMCLHVTAAIYCSLGQYYEAIPVLKRSIEIPIVEEGQEHALAKFAGHMQLGDTYAMLGQLENSTICFRTGLELQKQVLGEKDPRVGETCRYVAEAHVQALQFEEAQRICQIALDIHKESSSPASLEEAADRRLMGLICETKGDHEAALEHLVLSSMAMVANGQEVEVASIDCSIGDTYLSLTRYDESVFAYQKALTVFKTSKGENHPAVASVFVRLADLYNRTGKLRKAKSYCENALRIYEKPVQGIPSEEIASGLTDVSAIYESMNELDQALKLLEKALLMYNDAPGQQSAVAGIEAQMGVIYYMLGNYSESYNSLKNAIGKLGGASGEKKSAFFGIALNQLGLACVQRCSLNEAVQLFEEARIVLEHEYGPYHPDTLGVYSNLAGTYDAIGRLDDAIELLEYVVGMREEKLGTANPDVDDEKKRLAELLKEAGRGRSRKGRSLENLLEAHTRSISNSETRHDSVIVNAT